MTPYAAARTTVVFRLRPERAVLQVTGSDRLPWLQGLVTNDVAFDGPGAAYAAWLTPNGRMITDLTVVETGHQTWLDVPAPLAAALASRFDGMIFAEDARVTNRSDTLASIGMYGPEAVRTASDALGAALPDDIATAGIWTSGAPDDPLVVLSAGDLGVGGVLVHGGRDSIERLAASLSAAGVLSLDDGTATTLRVESGVPAFLVDMDEDTIPLEANLDRALSHTKGCYVGQEIIVRIRDRAHGRVARRLVGVEIDGGQVPAVPQQVLSGERAAGRLTSAVMSPALGRPIALATILREFTEPGTVLALVDGTAVTVAALPFPAGR